MICEPKRPSRECIASSIVSCRLPRVRDKARAEITRDFRYVDGFPAGVFVRDERLAHRIP